MCMRRLPGLGPKFVTSVSVAAVTWFGDTRATKAYSSAAQAPAHNALARFIRLPLLGVPLLLCSPWGVRGRRPLGCQGESRHGFERGSRPARAAISLVRAGETALR